MKLRQALGGKIPKKDLLNLKLSFDTVGSIAILEVDKGMEKYEKRIAKTLLELNKHIKTIVKKAGIHEGELRLQKMKWLAGKKTKETIHKESGVNIKLNVEKVYFSVRLGTERLRIAKQVVPGEHILCMFSGCAPYPCVLARQTKAKEIIGVELNDIGHQYGVENVTLNKLKNVTLYHGDVRTVVPGLKRAFDRIIMPLPHGADDFLDVAFSASKKGTIIHFYDFSDEVDIPITTKEKIRAATKAAQQKVRILQIVKCGSYAPRKWRVCADVQVV